MTMRYRTVTGLSLALLMTLLALSAGCAKKDDTLTAAPPPGPNAKPLPNVVRKNPRPRLPSLVKPGESANTPG